MPEGFLKKYLVPENKFATAVSSVPAFVVDEPERLLVLRELTELIEQISDT